MSIAVTENKSNINPYILESYLIPEGMLVLFKPHTFNEGRHSWALFKPGTTISNSYICYVPRAHAGPENELMISNQKAGIITGGTCYGLLGLIEKVKETYEWVGCCSEHLIIIED